MSFCVITLTHYYALYIHKRLLPSSFYLKFFHIFNKIFLINILNFFMSFNYSIYYDYVYDRSKNMIHNVKHKIVYEINKIIENLNHDPELHQILSNVLISLVSAFFRACIRIASACSSTRT